MSGQFTVNTGDLDRVAAQILANAQEYESIANKLMQTAQEVGGAYQRAAAQAFLPSIIKCQTDLKAMVSKLNQISEALKTQSANYQKVSAHNTQQARKLGR